MQLLTSLPIEIFRLVASHLSRQDMTECQCVRSCWYKKWTQFSYRHIHIRGESQCRMFFYNALRDSFMAAPHSVGYHIRKLIIENGHVEPFILSQLPHLCPYLEVFMFDGVALSQVARSELFQYYQQRTSRQELDTLRHHFAVWGHMRVLAELNGITIAHALLEHTADNLSSLSIQFNNQNDRTNSKTTLIQSLHRAPNLQSLTIERIYLTVEELELIHCSCPKLAALCLSNTVLLPMSAVQCGKKKETQPAHSLRRFQFINGSFCVNVSRWLNYISKKYMQARHLEVGCCSFFAEAPEEQDLFENAYESQLLQIAKSCTKLETFQMQSFCLRAPFFHLLDQNATYLKKLTLGDGATDSLAYELKGLLESRQRHSIKTLAVLAWPLATDIRGLRMLMASLGQCAHITTLHLSLGRHFYQKDPVPAASIDNHATVHLDVLLVQCPELTDLTLTDAKLAATTSSSMIPASRRYALQSLRLENVSIDSGSDIFRLVASHCTLLTDLFLISTISSPVYHRTRHFRIDLRQHRLKTLVLDRVRVTGNCSVRLGTCRFKIIQDMKTTWYDLVGFDCCTADRSFINHHLAAEDAIMSTEKMRARKVKITQDADGSHSDFDQSVYVSVVCKSIESLYLTGLCIE